MHEPWPFPDDDEEPPPFCLECDDQGWIRLHYFGAAFSYSNPAFVSNETHRCPYCCGDYWEWKGYA